MALKTSHGDFALLALVPPGNEARKLALFKRELFAAEGDASALAFPEILPLLWRPGRPGLPGSREARGQALRLLEKRLGGAWSGAEGGFEAEGLIEAGGALFLEAKGPLEALEGGALAALKASFPGVEWERVPAPSAHFALAASGFFLRLGGIPAEKPAPAPGLASPPRLSFRDAALSLFAFETGAEPLALVWRELASSRRKGL